MACVPAYSIFYKIAQRNFVPLFCFLIQLYLRRTLQRYSFYQHWPQIIHVAFFVYQPLMHPSQIHRYRHHCKSKRNNDGKTISKASKHFVVTLIVNSQGSECTLKTMRQVIA